MDTDSVDKFSSPTLKQLYLGFSQLGLMGFGGVLPLARRMLVEQKQWLNEDQFTDLLGICQLLPGGNILNMAVAIGMRFQGARGAVVSVFGLMSIPTLIIILLYQLYAQFQQIVWVQHMILGLAAAAAGLLMATGFKMLRPLLKQPMTYITVLMCFGLMLYLHVSLALSLIILFAINLCLLAFKRGRQQGFNL